METFEEVPDLTKPDTKRSSPLYTSFRSGIKYLTECKIESNLTYILK